MLFPPFSPLNEYRPPRAYPTLPAQSPDTSASAPEPAAAAAAATKTPSKGKSKAKAATGTPGRTKPAIPAEPSADALPPALPGEEAGEEQVALTAEADLYLYDETSGLFMSQQKKAKVKVLEAGRFMCASSLGADKDATRTANSSEE